MDYTYILTCADGTYYCGWTNNLGKRLKAHNQGKGTKYTRPKRPVVLSYYEAFEAKQETMRREYAIKHMSRAQKEYLIREASPLRVGCLMPQSSTSSHSDRDLRP